MFHDIVQLLTTFISEVLLMDKILHQLISSSSHYLQGFIHPWCRISSINSSKYFLLSMMLMLLLPNVFVFLLLCSWRLISLISCFNKMFFTLSIYNDIILSFLCSLLQISSLQFKNNWCFLASFHHLGGLLLANALCHAQLGHEREAQAAEGLRQLTEDHGFFLVGRL